MLEQIIGKKSQEIALADLQVKMATYPKCHIDIGTGDGLFAWRLAKKSPDTFVIGIDADRASLGEGSGRAAKKPARGGCPNAIFLCMNALEMPDGFVSLATSVSINFPWGSLLAASLIPDSNFLGKVRGLFINSGKLDVFINVHVVQNEEQRKTLGLPDIGTEYIEQTLLPAYENTGFKVVNHQLFSSGENIDVASTWGGRLTRGSNRPTLYIEMVTK